MFSYKTQCKTQSSVKTKSKKFRNKKRRRLVHLRSLSEILGDVALGDTSNDIAHGTFEVDSPHERVLIIYGFEDDSILSDQPSLTAEQKIWKEISNTSRFSDDCGSIRTIDVIKADIISAMRRRGSMATSASSKISCETSISDTRPSLKTEVGVIDTEAPKITLKVQVNEKPKKKGKKKFPNESNENAEALNCRIELSNKIDCCNEQFREHDQVQGFASICEISPASLSCEHITAIKQHGSIQNKIQTSSKAISQGETKDSAPATFDSFVSYYDLPNNNRNTQTLICPSQHEPSKSQHWGALSPRHVIGGSTSCSFQRSPIQKMRNLTLSFLRRNGTDKEPNIVVTGRNDAKFYPDLSDNDGEALLLLQH